MPIDTKKLMGAAIAAHQSGRLTECEELCRRILMVEPRNVDAKLLSGVVSAVAGQSDLAIERLEDVIRLDPRNYVALNWLSMLLRETERIADATQFAERAVSLRPFEPDALNNLGLCYLFQIRYSDALPSFERAVRLRPNQAEYLYGLANALEPLGRINEAIQALHRAIALQPEPQWLVQLANVYLGEGMPNETIDCCRLALTSEPDLTLAHLLLSQALGDLEKATEADEHLRRALDLAPNPSEIYRISALRHQSVGRFGEAKEHFLKSIDANPNQGFSYYGLVSSGRVEETDLPILERIEQTLEMGTLDPSEARYLHFALGKAGDNLGNFQNAMFHFDEANRLTRATRLANRSFDREQFSAKIDGIIKVFTKELFDEVHREENQRIQEELDLPLFVVGMMRSGTTLVEQILSCHPEIGAAGELGFWTHLQPKVMQFESGTIQYDKIHLEAQAYRKHLMAISPEHKFVTDKNPANFLALGLIHLAHPHSKIIHTRRNPIDTCLSIYMTPLKTPPEFACDRENIVFAYREYLRLMEHWRAVLPSNRLLEMDYEDLILERETTTRALVDFCSLDWNDECLYPDRNIRSIRTPSFWQVRQPIYATSINRWKNYEPWLGAFADLGKGSPKSI